MDYNFSPLPDRSDTGDRRPITMEIDGRIVLIPTVLPDGAVMSDDQAIRRYMTTRQSLGSFGTLPEAERAAGVLLGLLR